MRRRLLPPFAIASLMTLLAPGVANGCSWPAINSLRYLSSNFVFLVGTIGEPVQGGRSFEVERAWNTEIPNNPIVIAFKEGVSQAECGMTVSAGTRVFIAPYRGGGTLEANLATLLADPDGSHAQAFIAEATAMYGPAVVPPPPERALPVAVPEGPEPPLPPGVLVALAAAVAARVVLAAVWRRRRRRT